MEERGNKTVMCSVFFLDIVGYSKKSVVGQISLKDRFNSYLSAAIHHVPIKDRIILDADDGAVINFLGDVEDALKAALSLRESLLSENPDVALPLLIRMGINLGPVRLVSNNNGQANIVGDGINVAHRVMSFADAGQILVSRSYYAAATRLYPQYAKIFHYQGSRTDKHVREHEVYAIGYPGKSTNQSGASKAEYFTQAFSVIASVLGYAKMLWRAAATNLEVISEQLILRFRQAEPKRRAVYAGVSAFPVLLLIILAAMLANHDKARFQPAIINDQSAIESQPASAVSSETSVQKSTVADKVQVHPQAMTVPKQTIIRNEDAKNTTRSNAGAKSSSDRASVRPKPTMQQKGVGIKGDTMAYIAVTCREGTEVFVDGKRKVRIGSAPLTLPILPGKHTVIVSHPSAGVFSQVFSIEAGKTVRFKPKFCYK